MKAIYISDLDGTLLDNNAHLSEFSFHTLQTLLDEGLPFTVASARSILKIKQLLHGLSLNLPVISVNGAFLSNLETGRHEIVNSLDSEIAQDIYHLLPEYKCVPYISTLKGQEDRVYYDRVVNHGMRWYLDDCLAHKDTRWRKTNDLECAFAEQVICMTIIDRQDALQELRVEIAEKYGDAVQIQFFENEYSPGWYWLTIHDRRASKDQAITLLRERYGLLGSTIFAFGDNQNDLSMFGQADHAIAVANATDEVKARATEVIGSNLDDSVVKFLKQHWASN